MLKAIGKTDRGMVRAANQDSFAQFQLPDGAIAAVVCDGMGGAQAGNVASRNGVNIISQSIQSNYRPAFDSNRVRNMMLVAVDVANRMVYDMACGSRELKGMGTTVVACVVKNNVAHIVHAGDSRAYLIGPDRVERITKDHSVVQLLVDQGKLTEEEAKVHPKKRYITRALGIGPQLEADYSECLMNQDSALLICTDGLTNHLEETELGGIVRAARPEEAAARLVAEANRRGGQDNITALVIYHQIT